MNPKIKANPKNNADLSVSLCRIFEEKKLRFNLFLPINR